MNIYIYSDESGVFDKVHNDIFVFGGLIILGKESKEIWCRKYSAAERNVRRSKEYPRGYELKASNIRNKHKRKLYRSLDNCYKFGVVIDQKRVLDRIFNSKKDKQRYLDFAYKIAVKRSLEDLIHREIINITDIKNICFYVDEHTTATNGCYELKDALERELKHGTYNGSYDVYFPPLFPNMQCVQLSFCNSETTLLVRGADMVANRIYYLSKNGLSFSDEKNLFIHSLP